MNHGGKLSALVLAVLVGGCRSSPALDVSYSADAPSRSGWTRTSRGMVFGTRAGSVILVSGEARPLFRTELGGEIALPPALAGDTIVVATHQREVLGLDGATGAVRWRASEPSEIQELAGGAQEVFVRRSDGVLRAVDAAGNERWRQRRGPGTGRLLATTGDLVVVGAVGGGVEALSNTDGATRWRIETGPLQGLAAGSGAVATLGHDGRLTLLDGATGARRATVTYAPPVVGPYVTEKHVVTVAGSSLSLVSPADGVEAMRVELPETVLAPPLEEDAGALFVGTSGPKGLLLRYTNGKSSPTWQVRLDTPLRGGPQRFGERLLVLGLDGRVMGVKAPAGK